MEIIAILIQQGLVIELYDTTRTLKMATHAGLRVADQLSSGLDEACLDQIKKISNWTLSNSFTTIVTTVMRDYPEMAINRLFG